jgi:hypothetical protein
VFKKPPGSKWSVLRFAALQFLWKIIENGSQVYMRAASAHKFQKVIAQNSVIQGHLSLLRRWDAQR